MKLQTPEDGDRCVVITGTHKGRSGIAKDVHTSKSGHVTITVVQANGERVKALARNVSTIGRRAR